MSAKKRRHGGGDDHGEGGHGGGHERWLVSYADMITLLMALFVILFALGRLDLAKLEKFQEGFSAGLGENLGVNLGSGGGSGAGVLDGGPSPVGAVKALEEAAEAEEAAAADQARLQKVRERIVDDLRASDLADKVKFRIDARGLVVSVVTDEVLFDLGKADLRPEGSVVLDGLARSLAELSNQLIVEGHTDDRPINGGRFPTNWELSTARATTVLRYLLDRHGIAPNRISASGYADQQPIVPNDSDANRDRNRRVEIIVVSAQFAEATQGTP
ncbi:MAG TPA: flagellar motor protein MotB [Acidimicrobiia bacterium]|nr:flagellar motor protein MotB [Acidimicrobiia bacterium]